MTCPNCGHSCGEGALTCEACGAPLANAAYAPAPRKRRGKKIALLLLVVLLVLGGGAAAGYHFYIRYVEKKCIEATDEIFGYAKSMDFSDVDPAYLPEELKNHPNIRTYLDEEIQNALEEADLVNLLDLAGVEVDTDGILDEIVSSASYEVTGVKADYRSCTVSVHTENTDFAGLPETAAEKIAEAVGTEEDSDLSSLWESVRQFVSSLFSGESGEEEDAEGTEAASDLPSTLSEWYQELKESAPTLQTDGEIVYGIQDGKWTLLSVDTELFYTYYGLKSGE